MGHIKLLNNLLTIIFTPREFFKSAFDDGFLIGPKERKKLTKTKQKKNTFHFVSEINIYSGSTEILYVATEVFDLFLNVKFPLYFLFSLCFCLNYVEILANFSVYLKFNRCILAKRVAGRG